MKERKGIQILFALAAFIVAVGIVSYYWRNDSLESMQVLPIPFLMLALVYSVLQIGKRVILQRRKWWDWLYYIALTAMMLPVFFATSTSVQWFNWMTDIGSLFFVIPILFDVKHLFYPRS